MARLRRRGFSAVICCAVALAAGCTTVPPAGVAQFGQSLSALRDQSDTAIAGINSMTEEEEIQRAGTLPTISEDDVRPIYSADTVARQHQAFDLLQAYTNNLASLVSTDRPKDFEDAMQGLGDNLTKVDRNALPSPGVTAAVQELGRLIISAKAQSDALAIARATDPAVQRICLTMAATISLPKPVSAIAAETNRSESKPIPAVMDTGPRQNIADHWNERIKTLRAEFAKSAATATPDEKKDKARALIDLLNQRDGQLMALDSLHQSYLQLAQAHAALARGERMNLQSALEGIKGEVEHTRALFDKFAAAKKAKEEAEAADRAAKKAIEDAKKEKEKAKEGTNNG